MNQTTHIFVSDEMGSPGMKAKTPYVSGGFVLPVSELGQLQTIWSSVKQGVLNDPDDELKWGHLFTRPEEFPIIGDSDVARQFVIWNILTALFGQTSMLPLLYVARKERITVTEDNLWLTKSGNGSYKLNTEFLFNAHIARFALYLEVHSGTGEIWHDKLGSPKEEQRFQDVLNQSIKFAEGKRELICRVRPEIKFLDSHTSAAIQTADFICGVLFRSALENMDILAMFEEQYNTEALRNGVGILRVED